MEETIPQIPKQLISHLNNKEVFFELHETHRRKNEESTDDIKKLIIVPLGCGTEQKKNINKYLGNKQQIRKLIFTFFIFD